MFKFICNTSPVQYLYQIGLLNLLPELCKEVVFPPAVFTELDNGKKYGMDLPNLRREIWVKHKEPVSIRALPLINDLGPGETEMLMLALESDNPLVILDDRLAREAALHLKIRLTGTLGILLDAKKAGLIDSIKPRIDQLQALGFRLADHTRVAVLKLAGELS